MLKNYNIFSKTYETLGLTDAIKPDLKLLHNFPIQTCPYPILKIAKKFAHTHKKKLHSKKEITDLLDAGIIELSSSSYPFPIIFVRKTCNPGIPKNELSSECVSIIDCLIPSWNHLKFIFQRSMIFYTTLQEKNYTVF